MATVVFIYSNALYQCDIQDKQELSFGSSSKDDIFVPELSPAQVKLKLKKGLLYPTGKKIPDFSKEPIGPDVRLTVLSRAAGISMCWGEYSGISSNETFRLPYRGLVRIGRSKDNDIVLEDPIVSGHHLLIRCEDGAFHVEDGADGKPSTNGTYLNGKRITKAVLRSGDCIDLMHIRITMKNAELSFMHTKASVTHHCSDLSSSSQQPTDGQLIFRRSPRKQEGLPTKEIVLQKPPSKGSHFQARRGFLTSLLSSGAMIGASVAMGAVSPALLAARAASLISPVASAVGGQRANKKGQKAYEEYTRIRREKYADYIESQKALINQQAEKQREVITQANPAPMECVHTVFELRRSLWERSPYDPDFLDVRIGMGYEPLCVPVKTPADLSGFRLEEDEIEQLAREIVEETRIVDRVPARVRFSKYSTFGVIGQREKVVSLVKNMIISLCTAHFYEDVQIIGIFDPEERALWEPLRWLPHVWDGEKQSRFLAFDQADADRINDIFHDLLRNRMEQPEDYREHRIRRPHYVFLFGSRMLTERKSITRDLLSNLPSLGATAVFAYYLPDVPPEYQISYLPHECQFIIETDDRYGCCAYDRTEINNKFMFELDPAGDAELFDQYCRTMSAIQVQGGSGEMKFPPSITFLQGMGVSSVRDLNAWEKWEERHKIGVVAAPVAVTANGRMFELDIGNELEPPVVLVAGMSGSGKSEFLATWLLSLAVTYHPYEVSFVVIDFKGGALANSLEKLPHMLGKITDLKTDVQRTIDSLMYEIKRREMIFEQKNVQKLSAYMRGYLSGQNKEPLPYLLIVCDEFAELKNQQPEIAKRLDRVARVGRYVGIRLICAMQNPIGTVNDELRANSYCQVCLKVQNIAASKDMILRPDAARLTQNGRAYVRVGADVVFEQVQTYWSGAPYFGESRTVSAGNQVRIVALSGERVKTVQEEKTRFQSDTTELQAVSSYLARTAREHGIQKLPCPWKPELPNKLYLSDLCVPGGFDGTGWTQSLPWLQFPIGLYDYPKAQQQGVQFLNLEAEGHYGIYGTSGTGKTTLLKTILMSLGTWYAPEEVNLYLLDLNSWSLKSFEGMPHVGAVALGNETEKIGKILSLVEQSLAERKKVFSSYGISSLKVYRDTVGRDMPAIVLAIDNLVPLYQVYPACEGILLQLSSEGAGFGIYVIYTSNSETGIRFNFRQNIKGAVAFELNQSSDYPSHVGRVDNPGVISGRRGRGFVKTGNGPMIFQAAMHSSGETEQDQSERLKQRLKEMKKGWKGAAVRQIKSMPDKLTAADLLPEYHQRTQLPVGLSETEVKPEYLDFSEGCTAVVSGTAGGGKSRMLCQIAGILRQGKWSTALYVIDSQRRGLSALRFDAKGYAVTDEETPLTQMLKEIVQTLLERQKIQEKAQAAQGEKFERIAFAEQFQQICILVDDIHDFTETAGDEAYKLLRVLCKNGHGLGLICIGAGRVEELAKLSTLDPLTIILLASREALVVSGSASKHFFLKNDLSHQDKSAELELNCGLLYHDGTCKKIMLPQ